MTNWQKYAAEAFGSFVLVGVGVGVVMGGGGAVTAAFAFGFAWLTALYTVGRISGGHFNPVLSLAAFLDRAISLKDLIAYCVAQVAGALGAVGVIAWVFSKDATAGAANTYGPLGSFKAFAVEAILTIILAAGFLALLRSRSHSKYLGMGITLFTVTLFGFGVTTAGVNPARSLAPAVFAGEWTGFWVYVVGPIVGAIVGWVLYRVIVRGDTKLTEDLGDMEEAA